MANTVKLDFNAFRAFRQSAEVQSAIRKQAEAMAARANSMGSDNHAGSPLYEASSVLSESKGSVVLVSTSNTAARIDTGLHNTLLKAVGGGA
ncbi:MAG: hypothetical protein LKI88_00815 [Bifidobacterium sp.]|jgi:type IV secretory pathway TrbL component|nr:hypothetical protein [Bifidobacterium sp.]MCI1864471.1 hypothetical protein [Bifidobacterium sp.]